MHTCLICLRPAEIHCSDTPIVDQFASTAGQLAGYTHHSDRYQSDVTMLTYSRKANDRTYVSTCRIPEF